MGCCCVGVEEGEDIAGDGGCEGLVSAVSVPFALCGVDRDGEVFLSEGAWCLVWECACAQVVWGAVEIGHDVDRRGVNLWGGGCLSGA